MTKHTPATPLPWTTLEDGRSHIKLVHVETTAENTAGSGLPVTSINAKRAADAEYLTHAANAYPLLVGALRTLTALCDNVPIFQLDDGKASVKAVRLAGKFTDAHRVAAALLRELGEE
jgi:hypothetical protein